MPRAKYEGERQLVSQPVLGTVLGTMDEGAEDPRAVVQRHARSLTRRATAYNEKAPASGPVRNLEDNQVYGGAGGVAWDGQEMRLLAADVWRTRRGGQFTLARHFLSRACGQQDLGPDRWARRVKQRQVSGG